jgi:hypothetical protein
LFLEDSGFPRIFLVRQGFGCNLAVSSPFLYSLFYSMSFPPNVYRILLNCILKLALKRLADEGREKSETKNEINEHSVNCAQSQDLPSFRDNLLLKVHLRLPQNRAHDFCMPLSVGG